MFHGSGSIKVTQLNEDLTDYVPGSERTIITAADTTEVWGNRNTFLEATHAYKVGDTYYIFMCIWPSGTTKLQMVWKSDTINSGYEGKVIINDSFGKSEGVSQGGIIDMEDGSDQTNGSWMGFFMQNVGAAGRGLVLTSCVFDEDGWPVVSDQNLKVARTMDVPVDGDFEKKSIVNSWDFSNGEDRPAYTYQDIGAAEQPGEEGSLAYNGSNLMPGWEWNHNPDNRYWSLTERPGYLRLTNGHLATRVTGTRNVLTTRSYGPQSIGSVAMEIGEMKDGDVAGLAAFNRRNSYIGVKMEDGQKYLIYRYVTSETSNFANDDPWTELFEIPLEDDLDRLYFKVWFDYRTFGNERFYCSYSLDGEEWTDVNHSQTSGFQYPKHFCGFRFGLFNFATQETGGYVDFDYFLLGDEPPRPSDDYRERLENLINRVDSRQQADYTPDSWARLMEALADAHAVRDNPEASDQQLDAAYNTLRAALRSLVYSDIVALRNLLVQARRTDTTDWSSRDIAALAEAIDAAQALVDAGSSDAGAIAQAMEALQSAMSAEPSVIYLPLLEHTMATREDYNAVVDGYLNRVSGRDETRRVSYDASSQSMVYLTEGLWTSSGFKYDITDLVAEYEPGTQFKLSMEMKPGSPSVYIGFLYDNETNAMQGENFDLFTNAFTGINSLVTLREYSEKAYLYAYCGDPTMSVRNISLSVRTPIEDEVDRSELETLIAQANGLKEADYTPESWEALAEALTEARSVYEDENTTQTNVDAAATKLREAIEALEESGEEPIEPESIEITGSLSVKRGRTTQLTLVVEPEGAVARGVTWELLTPGVAEIDDNGLLTAGSQPEIVVVMATTEDGLSAQFILQITA